jgi:hypothetical protein
MSKICVSWTAHIYHKPLDLYSDWCYGKETATSKELEAVQVDHSLLLYAQACMMMEYERIGN